LTNAAVLASEGSLFLENEKWIHSGDTMDVATLALAYKQDLKPDEIRCCSIEERRVPFDSRWQYAAAFFHTGDRTRVAVKGGVEVVLGHCQTMLTDEGEIPLDREVVDGQIHELAHAGYRILAVADGIDTGLQNRPDSDGAIPPSLTLLGLVGFLDPVRPDVIESIRECHKAGVEVVMVTGDQPATALSIARTLAIATDESQMMTGTELASRGASDTGHLPETVAGIRVFARMTPDQKFFIVDALQKNGHYVAVTGDGVNDAPALRQANIGVAMGSGSDVAKDTASIIITDDNFTSIVAGIEEGRFAYDNIRKVTYLLISTGFAEVLLFTLSLIFRLPLPLLAVQLLWLNLVTNGIQDVALAFEKGEDVAMKRKPRRPEEGIFNRLMVRETLVSAGAIGLIAFGTWYWLLSAGWEETAARNMVILLMVLLENVHALNCRSEYRSAFRIPFGANPVLILGIIAAQGIHIISMYIPAMQDLLQIGPVSVQQWGVLLGISCLILAVMEVFKFFNSRFESDH
jgi:magnesium-transporting ATPase (P-type)